MPPEQADAERLLALNRGRWVVENRNHRRRDTTFGEDACLIHTGDGPSNSTIVNHTALAIIFHRGFRQVQAAVQHFAMDRAEAIRAVAEPGQVRFLSRILSQRHPPSRGPWDPPSGSRSLRPHPGPNWSLSVGLDSMLMATNT